MYCSQVGGGGAGGGGRETQWPAAVKFSLFCHNINTIYSDQQNLCKEEKDSIKEDKEEQEK